MADRNKTITRAALAGGAGLALWLLLRPGSGWGGGRAHTLAARRHCRFRLTSAGLTIDGRATTTAEAADACRGGSAELRVTGDASFGELERLRAALRDAGVQVVELLPGQEP
jgi:hypothetical protein